MIWNPLTHAGHDSSTATTPSVDVVTGRLDRVAFTTHPPTVTYRLKEDTAVSGRTIIIPDGYSPVEQARIINAICHAFDEKPCGRTGRDA